MEWFSNAAGMVKTVDDVRKMAQTPVTHIVVGSITVEPRDGNPEPRFWVADDDSWAINALGLPNGGIPYYRAQLPEMRKIANDAGKKLIVSIVGLKKNDWTILAERVAATCDGIELNPACPNVWSDGIHKPIASYDPEALEQILAEVKLVRMGMPAITMKLSPFMGEQIIELMPKILDVMKNSELVRAFVCTNTEPNVTPLLDVNGKPVISMPKGGASGPRIQAVALENVRCIQELAPRTPIIGVGGIRSGEDISRFAGVGATGFQVGTHFFKYGHRVFGEILQEYA